MIAPTRGKPCRALPGLPHYGERMAIGWLDIARHADTNGYEKDRPAVSGRTATAINAFNADMPFDRFVIEQMAGDMLPAHAGSANCHRFLPKRNAHEEGGIDVRNSLPQCRRPHQHHLHRPAWPYHELRAVPHPQVRPHHTTEYFQLFAFRTHNDVTLTVPDLATTRGARTARGSKPSRTP